MRERHHYEWNNQKFINLLFWCLLTINHFSLLFAFTIYNGVFHHLIVPMFYNQT